jgi:hypothetical protein
MYKMFSDAGLWRKIAYDWKQTAEMLAIELGDKKIADDVYEGIRDRMYKNVRKRMKSE